MGKETEIFTHSLMTATSQVTHGSYTEWVSWGQYKYLKIKNFRYSTYN